VHLEEPLKVLGKNACYSSSSPLARERSQTKKPPGRGARRLREIEEGMR
jgi:hypothetical protein